MGEFESNLCSHAVRFLENFILGTKNAR